MGYFKSSRYLRQEKIQIETADEGVRVVPVQRNTTVFEVEWSKGTVEITTPPGDSFPEIARKHLGSQHLWWLVADHNPGVFYPLDLEDGDRVSVPPARAVPRFRRRG